ncbi:hypothetical protein SARC_04624 [Sphaeroforma arctica JP610]|uniref:Uncharacterized protein n=1 Tax=Sphaeroforma arctica JP610 TaxID=667725 RepID=A0A0L0G211_9EUKA|nr:hypothetical protein SARC_04624 [Sphaeroforma arctica JP610]KNC83105.1 hypothetical protein SARC_04624 [Sphaeroforma arctica JP610]|eukprot:XP_014157007.1 hypothetical protein SARC_04624 [Sphaeroforma arctica JP610]
MNSEPHTAPVTNSESSEGIGSPFLQSRDTSTCGPLVDLPGFFEYVIDGMCTCLDAIGDGLKFAKLLESDECREVVSNLRTSCEKLGQSHISAAAQVGQRVGHSV